MDVHAARQPIFNRERELYGYELLFRSDHATSELDGSDDSSTPLAVLSDSLLSIGWDSVAAGKKAFVPFDRDLLLGGMASILPPEDLVVELLESVGPDAEVVAACESLWKLGYAIAHDDFVPHGRLDPLVRFASIIKMDVRVTRKEAQEQVVRTFRQSGKQLVADQVETLEEFQSASESGYDLFQGYFFARPTMVHGRRVPMAKVACMRLLSEAQKEDLDYARLEKIIREDVSFPYKLLAFANSVQFHFRVDIRSIEHALVVLGEQNVRHWIALAALPLLAQNKPSELVIHSLVRARFCERLAEAAGLPEPKRAFLIGLFSLLDALLDVPLDDALNTANIGPSIRCVLLDSAPQQDAFSVLYRLVRCYEQADWHAVRDLASKLRLQAGAVREAYAESTLWAHRAIQATQRKRDTRREVRHRLNANIRILWEGDSNRENYANAKLVNVSKFGMLLLVEQKIPIHTALSCSEPTLGISGRGSVRHCNFFKGKYLVGVEFSNGTGWRDALTSPPSPIRRWSA
jgi:EAL and modified HD-GYP domain-containing signal transduction protein